MKTKATTPLRVWWVQAACAVALAVGATGCAVAQLTLPPQMVEIEQSRWSEYDFKASTATGVVVAWRTVTMGEGEDVPHADLDFWVEATRIRMRSMAGYALLEERDVTSADGTTGRQLAFGRDENGRPHVYWVTLFTTDDHLHVVEAGGLQTHFDEARSAVEAALASYRVLR